jgi:hypothetical protein
LFKKMALLLTIDQVRIFFSFKQNQGLFDYFENKTVLHS